MKIDGLQGASSVPLPAPTPGTGKTSTFEDLLTNALGDANRLQLKAEKGIEALSTGQDIDTMDVVNAVTQADLAFRTIIQIRNKLVQAYEELRQMQI